MSNRAEIRDPTVLDVWADCPKCGKEWRSDVEFDYLQKKVETYRVCFSCPEHGAYEAEFTFDFQVGPVVVL